MEFTQEELQLLISIVSNIPVQQTVSGRGNDDLAKLRAVVMKLTAMQEKLSAKVIGPDPRPE